jgi:flagellar hook-associated protein 1 FlgK
MGIYSIAETSYAGLQIAQAGILTTSQNIAGTTIDGYSRRNANAIMDALAPNSLQLNGSSFAIDGFTRQYSAFIGAQLLGQKAKSNYSDTLVQYTAMLDHLVADEATSLTSALTNFFNAMGSYATDPTNRALASGISGAANIVADRMSGMSSIVTQLKTSTHNGLVDTIKQANSLLPELGRINQQIISATSPGNTAPSADLLDARDRILGQLQQLVGGQSLINSDQTATQLVNGMPLVERTIANKLSIATDKKTLTLQFNPSNVVGAANPVQQPISDIKGGQAGALLHLMKDFVPSIEKRLDATAMAMVKIVNSASQSAGDLSKVPIFGFKVGGNVYSNLSQGDFTSKIPAITSDIDLQNLYSSLSNAIDVSTNGTLQLGNLGAGSNSMVTSIFAGGIAKAGTYSFTAGVGDKENELTLSTITDGKSKVQTIKLADGTLGSSQNLNFDQLGLSIIVANPVAYSVAADSAIRTGQVYGQTRTKVNTLTVSRSTSPGTFTFSSDDKGGLTLSGTINGSPASQRIQLSDGTGNQMQYAFSQFGVTLGITNLNFDTAAQIAQSLSSLPNNTITVEAAIDSARTVASMIDGKNIIVTGGASALQQYGLTAANFVSVAPANPLDYMNGSSPYISAESANQVQRLSSVLGNSVADLVTDVGVQINTWNNAQSADTAVLKNLNEQRNQVSGVNLDEEAANLLKYQQLYSASSKVLQTGNQMFNALISIMN